MNKKSLLVLFGGQSSEHDISELSATNILSNLDTNKYDITMVGITAQGKWYLYEDHYSKIKDGNWEKSEKCTPAVLVPDASIGGVLVLDNAGNRIIKIDVVLPVLHGKFGEDGTIQGLCALAGLPCVGPDMLSSAICMDKTVAKILFQHLHIPQANWICVYRRSLADTESVIKEIEAAFPYPVFVKPACAGSSVGIGKAKNRAELIESLQNAALHDEKILVEEYIPGREIECAVLGNTELIVPMPGEVISAKEFYDFEAKYQIESSTRIPADIPHQTMDTVRSYAQKIFLGIGLSGMSRIDFFVLADGRVMINEVNTIPGFTDISMYPKMMESNGLSQSALLDKLICLAIEKHTGGAF